MVRDRQSRKGGPPVHDYITPDDELVFLSDFFQDFEKQITATDGGKKGLTMITTAGDEVFVAARIKPLQA